MSKLIRLSRTGLVVVTTISVGALFAAPAQAAAGGVASVTGTEVTYKAAKGTQNKVVVTRSGKTVTIDDRVAVKAGKGCKKVRNDKTRVRCTTSKKPTDVHVYTYDRNDAVVNKTWLSLHADGGSGNDRLTGGPAYDFLGGGSGNDQLTGLGGRDSLSGDIGNDRISGGTASDWISGAGGDDVLAGDSGHDLLLGGGGKDRMYGGSGQDGFVMTDDRKADFVWGGSGRDSVSYSEYRRAIVADADGVKGDDGAAGDHDTIATDIEQIRGGWGNDRIYGTKFADRLYGWGGNDIIVGRGGDDRLYGEDGQDKLYGEAGDDLLSGLEEADAQAPDLLDGGANRTAAGDACAGTSGDAKVACER